MQILFYDDLVADPVGVARRVFEHLEVDPTAQVTANLVNASGEPRSAIAQDAIRWAGRQPTVRAFVRTAVPYSTREWLKRLNIHGRPAPRGTDDRLQAVYEEEIADLRSVLHEHYGESLALPAWLRSSYVQGAP